MHLSLLYTLGGTAVVEPLGRVPGGERIKVEFRGTSLGPSGAGEANAVQELITVAGERLVVELRGHSSGSSGVPMEIRMAGAIRSSAARFADRNGRLALVVQTVDLHDAVTIHACEF